MTKKYSKYALIGKNIEKSLSPKLHSLFSKHFSIPLEYKILNLENNDKFKRIFSNGALDGANITSPFKTSFLKDNMIMDDSVKISAALNTIKIEDSKVYAYNTDGYGVLKALEKNNIDIVNKRVLIYGTGGAARGITQSLIENGVKSIVVENRSTEAKLIHYDIFNKHYPYKIFALTGLDGLIIDIFINASSPNSENPEIPNFDISRIKCDYYMDINYSNKANPILKQAKFLGIPCNDGLDMLIFQGFKSFQIWNNLDTNSELPAGLFNIIKDELQRETIN